MTAHPLAMLGAIVLLGGCVDPEGAFDAFAERSAQSKPDGGGGSDGGPCTVSPGSVERQYLLALSVTLSPTTPIVALTDLGTPAFGDGAGLALEVQPLRASDRATPVGAPISLGPFPIADDGSYRIEAPGLVVSGEANPVTNGEIEASVALVGSLCGDASFFCGALEGQVERPLPLPLAGSTFTFTRVEGTLPSRPAIDCSGTLADPL